MTGIAIALVVVSWLLLAALFVLWLQAGRVQRLRADLFRYEQDEYVVRTAAKVALESGITYQEAVDAIQRLRSY